MRRSSPRLCYGAHIWSGLLRGAPLLPKIGWMIQWVRA